MYVYIYIHIYLSIPRFIYLSIDLCIYIYICRKKVYFMKQAIFRFVHNSFVDCTSTSAKAISKRNQ